MATDLKEDTEKKVAQGTCDVDVDIPTTGTPSEQQPETPVEKETREQAATARLMTNADPKRRLRIYPLNKHGGKPGRCQFNIRCMKDSFPHALIREVAKSNMVSPHFGTPAIYYPSFKTVIHVQAGSYIVICAARRHYANGASDKEKKMRGMVFYRFKDDIDTSNHSKQPETNENMAAYLKREMRKHESLADKVSILNDYRLSVNVRNILEYKFREMMKYPQIEELIHIYSQFTNVNKNEIAILEDIVDDLFSRIDPLKFEEEYAALKKRSVEEDRQVKERYTGIPRQTAIRGGRDYRVRGARAYPMDDTKTSG